MFSRLQPRYTRLYVECAENMLMLHRHPALQFTHPLPYGAILHDNGVQFVVFSRSATAMRVLLYDQVDDPRADRHHRLRSRKRSLGRHLERFRARHRAGASSITCRPTGRSSPSPRPSLRSHRPADRSLCPGAGRRIPAQSRRHHPPAQVRRGRRPVRLAGRPPPAARPVRNA